MNRPLTQFEKSELIGKIGEEKFKEHIKSYPRMHLTDVAEYDFYREQDIDFMVFDANRCQRRAFEIKTDTYSTTGNIFIEQYSHKRYKTPGYIYKSKADILVYYFVNGLTGFEDNAFFLDLRKLKAFSEKNKENRSVMTYREVNGGYDPSGSLKTATGWTVKVRKLITEEIITKSFNWGTIETFNDWLIPNES